MPSLGDMCGKGLHLLTLSNTYVSKIKGRTYYRCVPCTRSRETVKLRQSQPTEVFFFRHVNKTATCWLWTGFINPKGYGQFNRKKNSTILAHKFSYELVNGKIPVGLAIDHLCRVRNCVNPAHLEAVTPSVNTQRSWDFIKSQRKVKV